MFASGRKAILMNLAVIAAGFALFGFGLAWFGNEIARNAETILETRGAIVRRQGIAEALAELRGVLPQAERFQAVMDAALPTEEELFDFRSWITGLATAHRVATTVTLQPRKVFDAQSGINVTPFRLDAEGAYGDLTVFLETLESGRQRFLISIDTVGMTRAGTFYRLVSQGRVFSREAGAAVPLPKGSPGAPAFGD
ncbi:MAG: hypothetical protein HY436_00515 [Candidatus Liptonbacteria bacterium]|nr:hypothetical protein [Candidatus Liptonbacteria bacterium]